MAAVKTRRGAGRRPVRKRETARRAAPRYAATAINARYPDLTLPAIAVEQFGRIKAKYSLAYRQAHRHYHERLESLHGELSGLDERLTVIKRLNSLDLGAPVAPGLAQQARSLTDAVRPCALKDNCPVDDQPRCNVCRWGGAASPPAEEAHALARRVHDAAGELCKRVAQDAIRKILEDSGRLLAEFDKAKKETAGKKRIRFFLR